MNKREKCLFMSRKERAQDLFLQGYNCAQAVCEVFAGEAGLSAEQMLKLSVSFGGGFLHGGNICGALTGVGIVLGCVFGEADADGKKRFFERFQSVLVRFEKDFGAVNCRELKPAATALLEYPQKPCLVYVFWCIDLIEELLCKN